MQKCLKSLIISQVHKSSRGYISKKHFKISFYGSSLSSLIFPLNYMNMTNIICPTKQIRRYNNLLSNKLSAIDFLEKTRRLAFNVGRDII